MNGAIVEGFPILAGEKQPRRIINPDEDGR